jgi:hypothetical protein
VNFHVVVAPGSVLTTPMASRRGKPGSVRRVPDLVTSRTGATTLSGVPHQVLFAEHDHQHHEEDDPRPHHPT